MIKLSDHNQSNVCFTSSGYSFNSVSVTIFQTFSCHDVGSQDEEEEYMTADYSVSCASERYSFAFWWAVAMVFVYPIGRQVVYVCYYWR
jgi:hypothetical protein